MLNWATILPVFQRITKQASTLAGMSIDLRGKIAVYSCMTDSLLKHIATFQTMQKDMIPCGVSVNTGQVSTSGR